MKSLQEIYSKYRIRGIVLIALLIPLLLWVIQKCDIDKLSEFLNDIKWSLLITIIVWLGCEFISKQLDKWVPWQLGFKRRLWIQMAVVTIYAVLVVLGLRMIFSADQAANEHFISNLITTVVVTWLVNFTGIVFYSFHELEKFIVENEALKKENLASQFEGLKNQVNPHFLFNSLNTLTGLIEEKPALAVEFVNKIAKVYRYLLLQNQGNSSTVSDELEFLKSFVYLNEVRFGSALNVQINVPESDFEKRIPNLSLQMLVENAIKHNVILPEKPLNIEIFSQENSLVVKNNLQVRESVESNGIGLASITHRYKTLSPDKEVFITNDSQYFTVRIPLL